MFDGQQLEAEMIVTSKDEWNAMTDSDKIKQLADQQVSIRREISIVDERIDKVDEALKKQINSALIDRDKIIEELCKSIAELRDAK